MPILMLLQDAVDQVLQSPTGRASPCFSPLDLADAVSAGLSLQSFEKVIDIVSPGDISFGFRVIPKATLARRRRGSSHGDHAAQKLSADESARVMRLAKIWAMARDVWQDDAATRDFLFRPHPLLEGREPINVVLANEFGLPIVENILGVLLYGAAA